MPLCFRIAFEITMIVSGGPQARPIRVIVVEQASLYLPSALAHLELTSLEIYSITGNFEMIMWHL